MAANAKAATPVALTQEVTSKLDVLISQATALLNTVDLWNSTHVSLRKSFSVHKPVLDGLDKFRRRIVAELDFLEVRFVRNIPHLSDISPTKCIP